MRVEIDEHSGFCFGVVNAIRKAEQELERGMLYCIGDIVHNDLEVASNALPRGRAFEATWIENDRTRAVCTIATLPGIVQSTWRTSGVIRDRSKE